MSPRARAEAEPAPSSSPAVLQSATGLIAHWPLNEGSGPLAADPEGGFTATLAGGAAWTTGRLGSGVELDGTQGYIAPPIIDVPGGALTLSAWVKAPSYSSESNQRVIISKAIGTSKQSYYWMLSHVRSGRRNLLSFRLRAGGTTTTLIASTGTLPTNTWFHAAATYDGATMRLYLDGVEVGRAPKIGAIATNPLAPVDIGRSPDGSNHLQGVIDEVRIYSRALPPAEIAGIMQDPGEAGPDTVAPSAPGNLLATAQSSSSVALEWSASTDDRGVEGYRVTRDGIRVATAMGTAYTDAGLTPSTTYAYRISAFDGAGNESAACAAVSVTTPPAEPPSNQLPTVTLTSPASGAAFTAPATVSIAASASDPEGRLADVRFYSGATLLGTDATAPYSFTWSGVPAGSYSITAVARDADGGTATSGVAGITVTAVVPTPWLVAFTASADHDSNVTSYLLEVFAGGADPNTATALASSDLGKPVPDANREIKVDRTAFLQALAAGTYVVTVQAIGTGGTSRSAPYTFSR